MYVCMYLLLIHFINLFIFDSIYLFIHFIYLKCILFILPVS